MFVTFAKISLFILCDFAELACSTVRDPNLATNFSCSLTNCILITKYKPKKLNKVKLNAERTYNPYPLIKNSSFVVANDTGPAHISAHLDAKGIALFGSHTTAYKVSIERENFKAIQAPELSKLSAEKVFERVSEIIS